MRLLSDAVAFATGQTEALVYRFRPEPGEGALPAVVLAQELWGVDDHLRDVAARLATAGYLVLAPDLYSAGGGRAPEMSEARIGAAKAFLDTVPPASWWDADARAAALDACDGEDREDLAATFATLMAPADTAAMVATLRDAVAFARADAGCSGRVGVVGFCRGGALCGLLACVEPSLDAAVVFYGAPPPADSVAGVVCPVLGFYGVEDPVVTGQVPAFAEAMRAAGKRFERHVYAGAPHAFFNDTRAAYHRDAARHAWARTLAFLDAQLGGAGGEEAALR